MSMRWSMLCIWYLFLWIASFSFFESSAILVDLSRFTVITTGPMKYSSEHLSNFIIYLPSKVFLVLFLLYLLDVAVFLFLCVVLGGMYYGMLVLLYGFLIFQFWCTGLVFLEYPLCNIVLYRMYVLYFHTWCCVG